MKKIFSLFLAANILFAGVMNFQSHQQKPVSIAVTPEKIILLQASMDCIVWGNLTEEDLPRADAALAQLKLPRSYKQVLSKTITKYHVYTAPFRNRQAAEREINKLRNLGFVSHRVSEAGERLNAIFFGEFEKRSTAEKTLEQLKEKSEVSAMILQHKIELRKYLIFDTDPQILENLSYLTDQFPGSSMEQLTCERL
jgi:SPOR domain